MALPIAMEDMEKELISYLQTKIGEGVSVLKKEKAFNDLPKAIEFINGNQSPIVPKALSRTSDNRLKKIAFETASSLTDVRPIWNYETNNEQFDQQGEVLNKLARGWWKNNAVDRSLVDTLLFSEAGGSGYAALVWNPDASQDGDFRLIPYDPRDVIPIDPVFSTTIQDWRGVALRQRKPIETVKEMFPLKAHRIDKDSGSWFSPIQRDGGKIFEMVTSVWSFLSNTSNPREVGKDYVDLIHVFIKDSSLHDGAEPIQMGPEDANWSYTVYPIGYKKPDGNIATAWDARKYPRGRMIILTQTCILDDGPNPYWHGMFPLVRFTLDPVPWSLLGLSMIGELIPLQNALNDGLRGLEDGMAQWIQRGVVADKSAIGDTNLKKIDTRQANMKVLLNPAAGDGFKVLDGPTFPNWYLEYLGLLKTELDELSGVRGLQQLSQLKQMPSEGTMEKYMDALSPLLRIRARSIEISLGELAEMLKVGFFQYYTMERRMQILGKDGATLEDFDFDPENMVPAGDGSLQERAERHHKNFTFSIAPNSFLNVSHMTQKMLMLQLLRGQLLDPWTAWDAFDLPNTGQPPAETIPERMMEARRMGLLPGPPPEVVEAQNQMILAQAQMALGQMAMMQQMAPGQGTPTAGAPNTSGVGPQGGRPPSGGQPPTFQQKSDGRTVVSESGGGGNG